MGNPYDGIYRSIDEFAARQEYINKTTDREAQNLLGYKGNKVIYLSQLGQLIAGKIKLEDCANFTITNNTANIVAFLRDPKGTVDTVKKYRKQKNLEEIIGIFKQILKLKPVQKRQLFAQIAKDYSTNNLKPTYCPDIRRTTIANEAEAKAKKNENPTEFGE